LAWADLARGVRRKPRPGSFEQAFLDELEALGIPTGDYNLPDWSESPEGFHQLLAALFRHTPPTALILQEAPTLHQEGWGTDPARRIPIRERRQDRNPR
jgi:hypothetical protein